MLRKAWNGDVSLPFAYWVLGVLGGAAWSIALSTLPLTPGSASTQALLALMSTYFIFVYVAIWRSAGKFRGRPAWVRASRLCVLIGAAITLIPIGIGFGRSALVAIERSNDLAPTSYEECVLSHVGSGQSTVATDAIIEACRSIHQVRRLPVSKEDVALLEIFDARWAGDILHFNLYNSHPTKSVSTVLIKVRMWSDEGSEANSKAILIDQDVELPPLRVTPVSLQMPTQQPPSGVHFVATVVAARR